MKRQPLQIIQVINLLNSTETFTSHLLGQSYQQQPQSIMDDAIVNWIEAEVVIDEEADNSTQLLDGQIDDFGLD